MKRYCTGHPLSFGFLQVTSDPIASRNTRQMPDGSHVIDARLGHEWESPDGNIRLMCPVDGACLERWVAADLALDVLDKMRIEGGHRAGHKYAYRVRWPKPGELA